MIMVKWYKEPYFDRATWLLTNFEKLGISNDELVFLLLVDNARKSKIKITYEYLNSKFKSDNKFIDSLIAGLVSKKYMKIVTTQKGVYFDIDGVFEFDPSMYEVAVNQDIYNVCEEVFNRPLTPIELEKISDLISKYGENEFNDALRMAEAYRKVNISYIEAILSKDEKK